MPAVRPRSRVPFRIFMILVPMVALAIPHPILAAPQGRYAPVAAADVPKLQFRSHYAPDGKYHPADFTWTFADGEFTIKAGVGAIPADLQKQLLPAGTSASEIKGKWRLDSPSKGQALVFSNIRADGKAVDQTSSIGLYRTAPTVVRIGEMQYSFGVGQ